MVKTCGNCKWSKVFRDVDDYVFCMWDEVTYPKCWVVDKDNLTANDARYCPCWEAKDDA